MEQRDIFSEAYERIRQVCKQSAEGLSPEQIYYRIEPAANSIAWLIWHLSRVQDSHVSEIAGREQAWVADGWAEKFDMEPDPSNVGFGHTIADVDAVRPESAELLLAWNNAVIDRSQEYFKSLDAVEIERVIDTSYDPHFTVGVRLVSVISDNTQHAGQARYLRGILERIGIDRQLGS